jgi:hypothetical protein
MVEILKYEKEIVLEIQIGLHLHAHLPQYKKNARISIENSSIE